jgi:hypothetical protein
MTRVTWHTAKLADPVWAIRRGHWQAAQITMRGRSAVRVRFSDTGNCAQRRYEEIFGRSIAKNGADCPADPAETVLSTHAYEVRNGAEN